jgi:ADP-heptose:LPS heptosyltransferase
MKNILITFPHGLGDAVQLTVVLKHLHELRPDWCVDVIGLRGKHSAWNGLCRRAYHDAEPQPHESAYDQVFRLSWWENHNRYNNRPNTKITNCLAEVFDLAYLPSLGRYSIKISGEMYGKTARYLESIGSIRLSNRRYNVVAIHYEGNTSQKRKNLSHDVIAQVVTEVRLRGYVPVILDWDNRSPIPDNCTTFRPKVGEGDLWGSFGSGDAESITALIGQVSLFIGIDSGPGKCASATDTPTVIVWTGHHPVQFHDPAPNTIHLIPEHHRKLGPASSEDVWRYFSSNYDYRIYEASKLPSTILSLAPERIVKSSQGIIAFSYCSAHVKAGSATISSTDHLLMLHSAMVCADRDGTYPKVISSIGAFGMTGGDDAILRDIMRSAVVIASASNPGHQKGAATAIRQALEYARESGFEFLVFLAEDIASLEMNLPARLIRRLMEESLDYVASPWGSEEEIGTQVFACRVDAMFRDGQCIVESGAGILERETLIRLRRYECRHKFDRPMYFHTHSATRFAEVVTSILNGKAGPLKCSTPEAAAIIEGAWVYRRVGYDQRPIEFREDGSIGVGRGGCERMWRLCRADDGMALEIGGDGGLLFSATSVSDGRWIGRWLYGERMPIELLRPSSPKLESDDSPLAQRFRRACAEPSDINEHLPEIWSLARRCDHVTEFGVRSGRSTTALMFARPGTLVSYDLNRTECIDELEGHCGPTKHVFVQADVRTIAIEPTECLVVDTFHSQHQLKSELELHADKVSRWIVLHDTTSFGETGEDGGPGLIPAVEGFLIANREWETQKRVANNNGLWILRRTSQERF